MDTTHKSDKDFKQYFCHMKNAFSRWSDVFPLQHMIKMCINVLTTAISRLV